MLEQAERHVIHADALVVIGTSLNVYPAAGLVYRTQPGIPIIVVDPNMPAMQKLPNLYTFEDKATTGVPKAIEKLLSLL